MKINNKIFPYPILSSDTDDYKSLFSTELHPEVTKPGYKIKIKNKLTDKRIEELINSGDAIYVIHLECNLTRFRKVYKFITDEFTIDIPKTEVKNRIEYCSMIIAKQKIENYSNEELDEDFLPFTYNFNKGEILAIGANGDFPIIDEETSLSRKDSIFSIGPVDGIDEIDYDISEDKIVINIPPKVHHSYISLGHDPSIINLIITGLIIPVLTSVIEDLKIKGSEYDHEDKSWFIALKNRMNEAGYPNINELNDNSIVIAQKLLDNPYDSFFSSIYDISFDERKD